MNQLIPAFFVSLAGLAIYQLYYILAEFGRRVECRAYGGVEHYYQCLDPIYHDWRFLLSGIPALAALLLACGAAVLVSEALENLERNNRNVR